MPNNDRVTEVYLGTHGDPETQRRLQMRIGWLCARACGDEVLDLGCSQGILAILLARDGRGVVGVDIEEAALAVASETLAKETPETQKRVRFLRGDAACLDFAGATFDCVFLGEVIEHVDDPVVVLGEALRVLKPDGHIVLTTPFGHLPHHDHRRNYGLLLFLEHVLPLFDTVELELLENAYIAFVGKPRSGEMTALTAESLRELFSISEAAFIEREIALHAKLSASRQRADQASRRYRAVAEESWAARALLHQYEGVRRLVGDAGKKWQRRLGRAKREVLSGTSETRKRYLASAVSRLRSRPAEVRHPPFDVAAWEAELDAWLDRMASWESDRFVLMYSGTTFIQPRRGNRPIRLTRILEKRNIPVLFGYWRWDTKQPIPPPVAPHVFQAPLDLLIPRLGRLATNRLAGKRRLFVATFPHEGAARWVNLFNANGWVSLYDCRDDWEEFSKVGMAKWWDPAVEQYLVNSCTVTTTTASVLQEKMQALTTTKTVRISPNALETGFVSAEQAGRLAPRSGEPVVGYWGHLTDAWFDWETLQEVARSEPSWRFEIIGHPPPTASLPHNIVYLGSRTPEEINTLCAGWRAALICFKVGPLSAAVDPIKIYEYLALGLPTATLTMPQIHGYPYVFAATDAHGLHDALEEAMSAQLDRGRIDAFLQNNRWEDRADTLLAILDEHAGANTDALTHLAVGA